MFRKLIQFMFLTALLAVALISCQVNAPIDENKIAEVNEKFMQAFTDGDAAAVAALYTSDAIVLPPFSDEISTSQDITELWGGMIDLGVTGVELVSNEIIPAGKMAIERGEYTVFAGELELDHGKFMVLWKMEDGQWKLHRDIWNSSIPVEEVVEDVIDEGTDEDAD